MPSLNDRRNECSAGKKDLPADSPLKVADPDMPFPMMGTNASMDVEEAIEDFVDDDGGFEELDEEGEIELAKRIRELENFCTHLAMKPWVEIESEKRKKIEDRTAEVQHLDQFMYFAYIDGSKCMYESLVRPVVVHLVLQAQFLRRA